MKDNNTKLREKIENICTYHGDEGTSGYLLSNKQFEEILSLFDEYAKEKKKKILSRLEENKDDYYTEWTQALDKAKEIISEEL